MRLKNLKSKKSYGFSLVETISVISLLGIITAAAIPAYKNVDRATREAKLTQDVRVLNSAIAGFIASGGNLDNIIGADQIITELKYSVASDERNQHIGFAGATIDLRLVTRREAEVSYKPSKVAIWNNGDTRFEITEPNIGNSAIAEFVLDDSIDVSTFVNTGKSRETVLAFNGNDGWVWESAESNHIPQEGPSNFETTIPNLTPPQPTGPGLEVNETTSVTASTGLNSANNPGFEEFVDKSQATRVFEGGDSDAFYIDQSEVPGWSTTASDGLIEIWESGFNGVDSNSGAQFVEFNATEVSSLYQEVNTDGASSVMISFAHGQRSKSTEQLRLYVGRNEPLRRTSPNQSEDLESQGFQLITQTSTDNVGGFTTYNLEYTITEEAPTLYFAFQSFGEFETQSVGNFLDDVSFRAVNGVEVSGFDIDLTQGTSISNIVESATVVLQGAQAGDELSIAGDLPDFLTYTIDTNEAGEIVLVITGDALRFNYEAALSQVRFTTESDDTTPRDLAFTVDDGFAVSDAVTFEINF